MSKITREAANSLANLEPFRRTGNGHTEVVVKDDDKAELLLHGNLIAVYDKANSRLTLSDAGWETVTTKSRLNGVLRAFGLPMVVHQKDFEWYIWDRRDDKDYEWNPNGNRKGVVTIDTEEYKVVNVQ